MRVNGVLPAMLFIAITGNAAAAPLIDNEHVTVWDVTLAPGESSPSNPMIWMPWC